MTLVKSLHSGDRAIFSTSPCSMVLPFSLMLLAPILMQVFRLLLVLLLLVFVLFSLFMLLLPRMLLRVFLIFFGPTVTGIHDLVLVHDVAVIHAVAGVFSVASPTV
jgi:hypothetical protein